jgi:hypothetical protein
MISFVDFLWSGLSSYICFGNITLIPCFLLFRLRMLVDGNNEYGSLGRSCLLYTGPLSYFFPQTSSTNPLVLTYALGAIFAYTNHLHPCTTVPPSIGVGHWVPLLCKWRGPHIDSNPLACSMHDGGSSHETSRTCAYRRKTRTRFRDHSVAAMVGSKGRSFAKHGRRRLVAAQHGE